MSYRMDYIVILFVCFVFVVLQYVIAYCVEQTTFGHAELLNGKRRNIFSKSTFWNMTKRTERVEW